MVLLHGPLRWACCTSVSGALCAFHACMGHKSLGTGLAAAPALACVSACGGGRAKVRHGRARFAAGGHKGVWQLAYGCLTTFVLGSLTSCFEKYAHKGNTQAWHQCALLLEPCGDRQRKWQSDIVIDGMPAVNTCQRQLRRSAKVGCRVQRSACTRRAWRGWAMQGCARSWCAQGPCVLFATPGMLNGGVSLEVFKHWAPDPKNHVVLPGYQVRMRAHALPTSMHNRRCLHSKSYSCPGLPSVHMRTRSLPLRYHKLSKGVADHSVLTGPRFEWACMSTGRAHARTNTHTHTRTHKYTLSTHTERA